MKIKVGLVGFGYWGGVYCRLLHDHNDAELVVVHDINLQRLKEFREKNPTIETTASLSTFRYSNLDCVIVCTPLTTHAEVVRQCLEMNLNVLCEKAFTRTVGEAISLNNYAKEKGLKLMVGHTFLYNSLVRKAKEIIDSGELGELMYLDFQRVGKSPMRNDVNAFWDLGAHDVAILLYWLGEPPHKINSFGRSYFQDKLEDFVFTNFEFSNHVIANVHCSWWSPVKRRTISVVGKEKMLVLDDIATTIIQYDKNDYQTPITVEYKQPLLEQLNDFINVVKNNAEPSAPYSDGIEVVKVLRDCQDAIKQKQYP